MASVDDFLVFVAIFSYENNDATSGFVSCSPCLCTSEYNKLLLQNAQESVHSLPVPFSNLQRLAGLVGQSDGFQIT